MLPMGQDSFSRARLVGCCVAGIALIAGVGAVFAAHSFGYHTAVLSQHRILILIPAGCGVMLSSSILRLSKGMKAGQWDGEDAGGIVRVMGHSLWIWVACSMFLFACARFVVRPSDMSPVFLLYIGQLLLTLRSALRPRPIEHHGLLDIR